MNQNSFKAQLAQVEQAGIYRLSATQCAVLERSAEALGFACFKVKLDGSANLDAILTALGRALDFPDWYGANLDALNDCLTDFSWREAKGYLLILAGADALCSEPGSFAALNEVLAAAIEQWQAQDVPFWVGYEYCGTGPIEGLASLPELQ
jgi:Barstar (barnase inhibitor)